MGDEERREQARRALDGDADALLALIDGMEGAQQATLLHTLWKRIVELELRLATAEGRLFGEAEGQRYVVPAILDPDAVPSPAHPLVPTPFPQVAPAQPLLWPAPPWRSPLPPPGILRTPSTGDPPDNGLHVWVSHGTDSANVRLPGSTSGG